MSRITLPPAKILVIDDEPSNVRLLERMLEIFGGLEWRCTTDPREAIPLFAEFQPDLVLTDLHMPHLDGYQVMEQLKQIIPEDVFLPIVVLTADVTPETRRKALSAGASDFITKPLDTTEVQLRLRNLLESRFLNQKLEDRVRQRTIELENALEQLRNTQEQVVKQERLRALGMMAGGIAHDFNNALTMMLGYGELMLPWFKKTAPEVKEFTYLKHIIAAAQDATHVVSRLRDFYRPAEADELRAPLEVNALCEQAVAFTTPKWKAKARATGATIEVRTDFTDVPQVLACAPELRESLTNLIFNAVDAMPLGGTITIATRLDGTNVRIDVIDTGTGMTEEAAARCLEPFFSTKGDHGTGLGLAVVYGIIQRHGGTIEIKSEKGTGTTFSLLLPATDLMAQPAGTREQAAVNRTLSILVVDDQEIICELISAHLSADGHEAVTVSDSTEAFSRFEAGAFDLVITDQSMPGLSGEQLAKKIRAHSPNTHVIMLTGFGDDLLTNGKAPEGIEWVLSKPVSSDELRRAIFEVTS
ncbi:MAG: response regulator [Chthoniobacteraceae bacterium]